jgi:hypothetical protein
MLLTNAWMLLTNAGMLLTNALCCGPLLQM